ncbi:MAG: DUF3566 domain-containing protein [Dermatophilaceae bacterium]
MPSGTPPTPQTGAQAGGRAPGGTTSTAAGSATPATQPHPQAQATATPAQPMPTAGAAPTPASRSAAATPKPAAQRPTTRRVRLAVARVDPWSVMKMSFLLSVAAGIALVIATAVLWMVLSGLNVFSDLDRMIRDIQPSTAEPFSIMTYIGFARVISLSIVIAVIDVILLTALATLSAYLYNICSALVGGVQLTLTDD